MMGSRLDWFIPVVVAAMAASAMAYTVIVPDSVPSTLVDTPQTGLSIYTDNAHTDPNEQQAVYDIMKATGNGWATTIPDICKGRWHGIECVPDNNRILHVVSLSFGALSDDTAFPTCEEGAYISPSLTKLPHIRRLFFYKCCTDGPQPILSFLGRLGKSLESLVLRENGHVGIIPEELGNLTQLKVLDLHGNGLVSSIPNSLGSLSNLRLLDLSENKLEGQIPQSIKGLRKLNVLNLNKNLFHGPIPDQIGCCTSLIKLDLSSNQLTGPIPDKLESLKSLLLMDLSFNELSGPIPSTIGELGSLEALVLKGNQMGSSQIPESFGKLQSLMAMVMSNVGLSGPIPESLGKLSKLRVLHLDNNRLNGTIPKSLSELGDLSELRLNQNKLTGPVPFTKEMLWRLGRNIHLSNNSGLCYSPEEEREEDDGSLSPLGIKYCKLKTTAHISSHRHLHLSNQIAPFPSSSAAMSRRAYDLALYLVAALLVLVWFLAL
ncbi:hypothetical protein AMTRI_Chr13g88490 [Amborella trichopoda]